MSIDIDFNGPSESDKQLIDNRKRRRLLIIKKLFLQFVD